MIFKITYNVHGMLFEAIAHGASEAFDYVKAIIRAEKTMYPNQQESFDHYFGIVNEIASGKVSAFSSGCGLFKIDIERVNV
ncbi:MAG: hypothetical protein J6S14_02185 [Clostridia bacterium]|nr:hypothetical protein [Clostridia bacterium]